MRNVYRRWKLLQLLEFKSRTKINMDIWISFYNFIRGYSVLSHQNVQLWLLYLGKAYNLLNNHCTYTYKTYLSLHIPLKTGGLFWFFRNPTFFKHHSMCQTRTKYFQIKNVECTFMNLSLYTFFFATVISIAAWTTFLMISKSWRSL